MTLSKVTGPELPDVVPAGRSMVVGFHLASVDPLMFDELEHPARAEIVATDQQQVSIRLDPVVAAGVRKHWWLAR